MDKQLKKQLKNKVKNELLINHFKNYKHNMENNANYLLRLQQDINNIKVYNAESSNCKNAKLTHFYARKRKYTNYLINKKIKVNEIWK